MAVSPERYSSEHRKKVLLPIPKMGCICAQFHQQGSSLLVTQLWTRETEARSATPQGWEADQGNQAKINCFFLQRPLPQRCDWRQGSPRHVRAVSRCGRSAQSPDGPIPSGTLLFWPLIFRNFFLLISIYISKAYWSFGWVCITSIKLTCRELLELWCLFSYLEICLPLHLLEPFPIAPNKVQSSNLDMFHKTPFNSFLFVVAIMNEISFVIISPSLFLLLVYRNVIATAAKSLQLCPTLCDPIDGSPLGSPVPGIFQARTLEWVAISFSKKCH